MVRDITSIVLTGIGLVVVISTVMAMHGRVHVLRMLRGRRLVRIMTLQVLTLSIKTMVAITSRITQRSIRTVAMMLIRRRSLGILRVRGIMPIRTMAISGESSSVVMS